MKQITFKGKKIEITKDKLFLTTGFLVVLIATILLGLFSWAKIAFNGNFDAQFWINYSLTMGAVLLGFSGMLITRLTTERKKPQRVIAQQKLKNNRATITKNKKINAMKLWLKWIYNYQKRVDKLQELLTTMQEKLKVVEKPADDMKEFSKKKYKQIKNKYDAYIEKKNIIEKHLKTLETHQLIIEHYKKSELGRVKELQDKIEDTILSKVVKKVPVVTYAKIFNGAFKSAKDESIEINYGTYIIQKVLPKVLIGACLTLLFTSIIPDFVRMSFEAIVMLVIKLTSLITYLFFAVSVANDISNLEYCTDENRLIICEMFMEDLKLNLNVVWEEVDERENDEQLSDGTNADNNNNDNGIAE